MTQDLLALSKHLFPSSLSHINYRTWIIPLSSMMETTPNVDEELFTLTYYMSSPRFLMWFVLLDAKV
jgi:hypothetical protein